MNFIYFHHVVCLSPDRHNNAPSAEESWNHRQSDFFDSGECQRQQGKKNKTAIYKGYTDACSH